MKKKVIKLIVSVFAFVIVTVAVFSSRTLSYFSDNDNRMNVTVNGGGISGELIETTVPLDGGAPIAGPTAMRIVPGACVQKTVFVENTGTGQMYLRLTVDKEFTLSEQNRGQTVDPSLVQLEINTAHWTLIDGFYYYKTPIDHGAITEPLFTAVKFSSKMDNTYTNSTITLHIKAYATQVTSNGTSVFEAENWPAVQ